jgi:hypothetical protein
MVAVLEIAPAVPDTPVGVNTMRFGVLKFARFSRLKISALNCSVSRSWSEVSFTVEKSQVASPGPTSVFLPRLP